MAVSLAELMVVMTVVLMDVNLVVMLAVGKV